MRLPISPFTFLARLIPLFFLTYYVWGWVAPFYTELLLRAAGIGVWLSEFSTNPLWSHGTTLIGRGTAVFYRHRNFAAFNPPLDPQGIPAEWVMANLVLLVPLMLATPAPSWRARFGRLALALVLALVLQVLDIIVAIKSFYAGVFRGHWSATARQVYQFLDAFFQSFDTQLFPFAIWAGIHFRLLLGGLLPPGDAAPPAPSRSERRRKGRPRPAAAP
jgi:hypothetical protein